MSANPYEAVRSLSDYLLFHYGSDEEVLPWPDGPRNALGFPRRSVRELIDSSNLRTQDRSRALDIGCAVGRSCYELAEHFAEVIGIDFSASFIRAAEAVRRDGGLAYSRHDEGVLETSLVARRPDTAGTEKISFRQGDAMSLDVGSLGGAFDLVHAANLICRLPEPLRLLRTLPDLVKPGGQLLLTTPSTWLEEYTPHENWPDTEILTWLRRQLEPAFTLEHQHDMPMLIRETRRKYQWTMVPGTRWRRC